jgi:hypothetical protein
VADDIVTRLRKFECRCELVDDGDKCDSCDAADEIERLRHRVDRLNAALDDVAAVTADKGILHRVKEAQRG